jgi:hypothetical protein
MATNDQAASPTQTGGAGYQVVARRYRPQRFADLVGQEHVARGLSGAIVSGRIGHAYLFTGARGVGKTSAARIFAKALQCDAGPADEPCNEAAEDEKVEAKEEKVEAEDEEDDEEDLAAVVNWAAMMTTEAAEVAAATAAADGRPAATYSAACWLLRLREACMHQPTLYHEVVGIAAVNADLSDIHHE